MKEYFIDNYGSPTTLGIVSVVVGIAAVVTLIVVLIIKSLVFTGEIVSITEEPLRIYYTQEEVAQYSGSGEDRHFSHHDYVIYENIDNIDHVVKICGKNGFGRIKESSIFVTEERANSIGKTDNVGWFAFNRRLGDRRLDPNNQKIEVGRYHSRQNMSAYGEVR